MHIDSTQQHSYFSTPDTMLPVGKRNYCLFNQDRVDFIASQKEASIPYLKSVLSTSTDEKEIVETLYIANKMIDNKTGGMSDLYPFFAKFNDTKSPNIQTFLAGIYRKIQVPDAFGPLVSMLIKNSIEENPAQKSNFDANEEIGGAILSYIENYASKGKVLDISA